MRKIGIIGLGHKAEPTIRLVRKAKEYEIFGVYDPDYEKAGKIAAQFQLDNNLNPFGLIASSDLLIVSKSDSNSFNLIVESIMASKHVIIDNPLNLTIEEINELIKLAGEASVSIVPFLPYTFSSCLLNTKSYIYNPVYIELRYKTAPVFKSTMYDYTERIMNIVDIILNLIKGNVKTLQASQVVVVGNNPNLVNIRLEFDNGCVGSIVADYLSNKEELFVNVYQPKQIVTLDLVKNIAVVKTFNHDSILDPELTKPVVSRDENPYLEILNYLNAFESFNTPITVLENFKNTFLILKKIQEKLK